MANKPQSYLSMKRRANTTIVLAPKPDKRPSAAKRGYDSAWQFLRKWYLKIHPLCVDCMADNKVIPAKEVHHIVPLSQGGTHDESNLMALCKTHHSRRTMKERQ